VKPSVSRIQARHWGLVAIAGLVAWGSGTFGAGGTILGGFAAWGSLVSTAGIFHAAMIRHRPRLAISILSAKLLALLGLTWFAFTARRQPDPIGFVLGVSCLPLAAVWEALRVRESE